MYQLHVAGVDSLILYFGEVIDERLSPVIVQAVARLQHRLGERLLEVVPSYTSVWLQYDIMIDDYASICAAVEIALQELREQEVAAEAEGQLVVIPVCYHPELGEDLLSLAEHHGLTVEEVIALHTGKEYRVFAQGFMPGFAFMGKVEAAIATPRKQTPRKAVPRGAVGIADQQTGVYPDISPGGWNLVGRTPVRMFDAACTPAALLKVGDRVRFAAISLQEYDAQGGER